MMMMMMMMNPRRNEMTGEGTPHKIRVWNKRSLLGIVKRQYLGR
jgi:hypothetical protein